MDAESNVARPRRRGESEKRAILSRQAESGLSVIEFCRREGIAASSFHSWKKGLRKNESSFIQVLVEDNSTLQSPAVEIHLPAGERITVTRECDPEWLARFVRILRVPSC